ncbi:MAG: TIGR03936 family radical SAM-associated protein [Thermodesulfovibrionales bacterium]|nr:TIGR03936 family radical SAM-associated protein [Thermodesulfovibrionales bacterium]
MSRLEAFIARGDENISEVIRRAWELGAILDGWTEYFDYSIWKRASEETGIYIDDIAEKSFPLEDILPWDFVDIGVEKDFLKEQYKTALNESFTPSCVDKCSVCGLNCGIFKPVDTSCQSIGIREIKQDKKIKIRVCYSKYGLLKHLSHLELTHTIIRALKRAEVKNVYSAGFNPAPIISFGPPLNVGVGGLKEFFDMEVFIPFDIELTMQKINNTLPEGIKINNMSEISFNSPSLTKIITRYDYLIKDCLQSDKIFHCNSENNEPTLREIKINTDNSVILSLIDTDTEKARLSHIVKTIFNTEIPFLDITRTALYGFDKGWYEPL